MPHKNSILLVLMAVVLLSCASEKPNPETEKGPEVEVISDETAPQTVKSVKKAPAIKSNNEPKPVENWLPDERYGSDVSSVIESNQRSVQSYFETLKRSNPSLAGKLELMVSVDPGGKVVGVTVKNSTFTDDTFEKGVINRIKTWTFSEISPKAGDKNYPVNYVF